jgi:hypothetical protein
LPATRAVLDAAHIPLKRDSFPRGCLAKKEPSSFTSVHYQEARLSCRAPVLPTGSEKNEREQVMRRFAEGRIQILAGVIAASLAWDLGAHAQDTPLPPNTLPCDAFTKKSDGTWFATRPVTFDVGNAKNLNLDGGAITPKSQNFGGVDLYVLLDAKCGKTPA